MATNLPEELEKLRKLINEGWSIYGAYLDSGEQDTPLAQEVRHTIYVLETTRAKLRLLDRKTITEFLENAKEFNNG